MAMNLTRTGRSLVGFMYALNALDLVEPTTRRRVAVVATVYYTASTFSCLYKQSACQLGIVITCCLHLKHVRQHFVRWDVASRGNIQP